MLDGDEDREEDRAELHYITVNNEVPLLEIYHIKRDLYLI